MLPGNTFLHKILPTMERQSCDLWGLGLQEASGGLAWLVGRTGGERRRAEGREGLSVGLAARSQGRRLVRGKGFVGGCLWSGGAKLVLGLTPHLLRRRRGRG